MAASAWRRLWRLEEWRLGPKVAVVVVFPLAVAMVLGSVQLVGETRDAIDLANSARCVDHLKTVVAAEDAVMVVAGRRAAGTVVVSDVQPLNEAITDMDRVKQDACLPHQAVTAAQTMVDTAAALRSPDLRASETLDAAIDAQQRTAAAADTIVDAVLAPLHFGDVVNDKHRLLDTWALQRQEFAIAVSVIRLIRNPSDPGTDLIRANGAMAALLARVSLDYPSGDADIAALSRALETEAPLGDRLRAALPLGPAAIRDVGYGDSLVRDMAVAARLVNRAASTISDAVAARVSQARTAAIRDAIVLVTTVVLGLAMAAAVARALLRPLRTLHDSARQVARVDLPEEVARIYSATEFRVEEFTPLPIHTTEEIGRVARAVDDIHGQALKLAGQQHQLRVMVNELFDALARRTKSLLERQLQLISSLEQNEDDHERLADLFQLDHLATRMRRNSDNLMVLAGTQLPSARSEPLAISDVLRAAASEVEQYQRVQIGSAPPVAITGATAVDIVHLIAELADNALRASPPDADVLFESGRTADGGVVIYVVDYGVGLSDADLAMLNERLASADGMQAEAARRMGLFVVGRLAQRHGVTVYLQATGHDSGTPGVTAAVIIPVEFVRQEPAPQTTGMTVDVS